MLALVILDILVFIVLYQFVQVTATMLELVLLLTLVIVSEAKWELIVQLIVAVEVMEHATIMELVFVILDLFSTLLLVNVNILVLINQVQTAMVPTYLHAVQDVLVELAIMALVIVGLVLVE